MIKEDFDANLGQAAHWAECPKISLEFELPLDFAMKLQHDTDTRLENCIGLTPKWILGSNVLIQRSSIGVTSG